MLRLGGARAERIATARRRQTSGYTPQTKFGPRGGVAAQLQDPEPKLVSGDHPQAAL
jgi:hypothetical protein